MYKLEHQTIEYRKSNNRTSNIEHQFTTFAKNQNT